MRNSIAAAALLAALLFLHGMVPFLALPTLGQAVWTGGFAQSFVNDSLLSVHATNFGAPRPAPITFGLAGAWPVAALIACGLHPADAYAAMAALWLGVAFLSAARLARMIGAPAPLALLAAVLWLTMPMVWAHASYSMLSLGIALLPFYFLCALILLQREASVARGALYMFTCLVAVFMDGYSFVMFVAGGSLLGAWTFMRLPARRRSLLRWALPLHVLGVGLACGLYLLYLGNFEQEPAPLESFRGWGLDLAYLAVPTQGVHWIADALGLSVPRSEEHLFGDVSVWRSSFALPLIAAALWAWWKTRRTALLATGCLVILAASFYMALGPSLKIGAQKPAGQSLGREMPAEYALAPTGSGWLSTTLPGLRSMRASYRWLALTVFSAWLLLVLLLAARERADRALAALLAGALALVNLPDMRQKWRDDAHNREMFLRIDAELLRDVQQALAPRTRVAFLPYRNDFLVNYLAARADLVSYNIGGDKNLHEARRHWPETLRAFRIATVDEAFPGHVILLLARREADAVALPYIDLLWAAHDWPAPAQFRESLQPTMATLKRSSFVEVEERAHYALIRLNDASARRAPPELESAVLGQFCMPPICLRQNRPAGEAHQMMAGRYRLAVYGTGGPVEHSYVEVVSAQASAKARFPLSAGRDGLLAEGLVRLHDRAEDLEVRIIEGQGDVIRLERYELVPLNRSAG
jgi:hypothetical protein